jgi:hypothetical protein
MQVVIGNGVNFESQTWLGLTTFTWPILGKKVITLLQKHDFFTNSIMTKMIVKSNLLVSNDSQCLI